MPFLVGEVTLKVLHSLGGGAHMAALLAEMKVSLSLPHSTLDLHERGAKELTRSGSRRQEILLMPVSLLGEGTGKDEGGHRRG